MSSGEDLRMRPAAQRQGPAGGAPGEGGNLDALRAEGDRLLAAADEAIDRVLSGNSTDFLRASRQHGGE